MTQEPMGMLCDLTTTQSSDHKKFSSNKMEQRSRFEELRHLMIILRPWIIKDCNKKTSQLTRFFLVFHWNFLSDDTEIFRFFVHIYPDFISSSVSCINLLSRINIKTILCFLLHCFFFSYGVIDSRFVYFRNFYLLCSAWRDQFYRVSKFKSIFYFNSHAFILLIILSQDSDKSHRSISPISFVELRVCIWISGEESWDISSVCDTEKFSGKQLTIIAFSCFYFSQSFFIGKPYRGDIVYCFVSSFYLE